VFPWRSFEAYPIFCRIAGAEPRPVPLLDDGHLDLHTIACTIDERTSLVYLCSPNNPSGAVVPRAGFDDFMARVPGHVTVAL
ncbi:aminotransferase class I/II-fold pyridoxal phosphate-dependent enzyme, partial [Rhizobium ruizarguesonis]